MSLIRLSLILFVLFMSCNFVYAQVPAKTPKAPAAKQAPINKTETVEEVDGFWELSGYLGKKLMNEMGNRMNLEETPTEKKAKELKTKRVKIKVGPFKFERIESI